MAHVMCQALSRTSHLSVYLKIHRISLETNDNMFHLERNRLNTATKLT